MVGHACSLLLSLLPFTRAFRVPEVWNFTNYIENGDPSNPIHIVVTCHRDSDHKIVGIVVHQAGRDVCAKSRKDVNCIYSINPWTPEERARECREVEYPLLRDLFANAPEGAIGFPTQFWESGSWFRASARWPVAISPIWAQEIFENKVQFAEYMETHGHAKYVPKSYRTEQEIVYPCIVKLKPMTGSNSAGVMLIRNSVEMAAAMLKKSKQEPPQIQEAIDSKAEVTIFFAAFRGRLLNMNLCKASIGGELDIMNNKQKSMRVNCPCKHVPGFAHHIRPLFRALVEKLQIDGFGFANMKLRGVTNASYFEEDTRMHIHETTDNSFVKILEINARIGGGLYSTTDSLGQFIRTYHLAYHCEKHGISAFDELLFHKHIHHIH